MDPATTSTTTEPTLSRIAGKVAVAVGLLVLTGWIFKIEALKRVLPQFVAVNPATALCLVLVGIAFECRRANKTSNWARLIAIALALVVACVGALKLSNYAFGWPF